MKEIMNVKVYGKVAHLAIEFLDEERDWQVVTYQLDASEDFSEAEIQEDIAERFSLDLGDVKRNIYGSTINK